MEKKLENNNNNTNYDMLNTINVNKSEIILQILN